MTRQLRLSFYLIHHDYSRMRIGAQYTLKAVLLPSHAYRAFLTTLRDMVEGHMERLYKYIPLVRKCML